jgi:hypothetical protein
MRGYVGCVTLYTPCGCGCAIRRYGWEIGMLYMGMGRHASTTGTTYVYRLDPLFFLARCLGRHETNTAVIIGRPVRRAKFNFQVFLSTLSYAFRLNGSQRRVGKKGAYLLTKYLLSPRTHTCMYLYVPASTHHIRSYAIPASAPSQHNNMRK